MRSPLPPEENTGFGTYNVFRTEQPDGFLELEADAELPRARFISRVNASQIPRRDPDAATCPEVRAGVAARPHHVEWSSDSNMFLWTVAGMVRREHDNVHEPARDRLPRSYEPNENVFQIAQPVPVRSGSVLRVSQRSGYEGFQHGIPGQTPHRRTGAHNESDGDRPRCEVLRFSGGLTRRSRRC